MRRLWKGLLIGSVVGGLAYLLARRSQGGGAKGLGFAYRRTARSVRRQLRDAQGAWRVGRRVVRRRQLLSGVSRLARRFLP